MQNYNPVEMIDSRELSAEHRQQIDAALKAIRAEHGPKALAVAMIYHNLSGALAVLARVPADNKKERERATKMSSDAVAQTMTFISMLCGINCDKAIAAHNRLMSTMDAIEADILADKGDNNNHTAQAAATMQDALARARAGITRS